MSHFSEHDCVRLLRPLPEHGLTAGAVGTIVVITSGTPGFLVEFCDADGGTIAIVALDENQVAAVVSQSHT